MCTSFIFRHFDFFSCGNQLVFATTVSEC
uniref:Uncharacterized protein n=1 Tax=Arundo donax TaxID=35708 RepID=A0A0A9A2C1_ARUDO